MTDMLLRGLIWVCAIGYIDDTIFYTDTWLDHRSHLQFLFTALHLTNLHLHPGKSFFDSSKVQCLGHIGSSDGIRTCPINVPVNLDMPAPHIAKVVQLSATAPYDEGEGVVAYTSRVLLEHEKRWKATEPEAAALVWALEAFCPHIDGVNVSISTEHFRWSSSSASESQCRLLERWALRLQELQFTVAHRPGVRCSICAAPLPSLPPPRCPACIALRDGDAGPTDDVEVCLTDVEDDGDPPCPPSSLPQRLQKPPPQAAPAELDAPAPYAGAQHSATPPVPHDDLAVAQQEDSIAKH
ncbi:hypothetical protein Esti_001322 [Eimeria stiedai]